MKTQKQDLGKVSLTCNGTWDAGKQYDRLCIVNDGNFASYISKKDVPIGTVLSDERFWQPIANLRDDIKIDYETFKKEWLELLASIQIKLRSARVVVANEEARNNLTWLEVAAGCEVYELDTQLTYILDSIVPVINLKSWHLVVGSLLDSEAKFQLDGTYELTAERAIADRWGYIIDEVYVSKKEVKNLVLSIVNDKLENISITIPPNSIKPEDLSQAVLDLIGSGGNVVNNPDEEDITSESLSNGTSVLKFKDRDYVEGTFNGLGEIILRKNQVGIVNLLEQVNINKPNTVYVVRYDFCLGGATITLPKNSTLKFEGGSIDNGTIVGSNTKIKAGIEKIFDNITINGTWNCSEIYDDWFTKVDDSFVNLQNMCNLTSDVLLGNIYINQNHTITIPSNAASIKPNSNTIINIKGTIAVNPNEFTNYYVFRLIDKNNVTFTGGGSLIGDVETHTGTTGEWGHGLFIQGSNNITISNLNLTKFWGDGIEVDKSSINAYTSELYIKDLTISNNRRQGISLLSVKNIFIDNCIIYGIGSINGTNPKGAIDIEPEGEDIAENVFISNCIEYSNGLGITAHNAIKGIVVDNCTCLSSQGIWHTGDITFKNCSFGRYFNLEGDIIKFINCDMPITNIISSNLVEIDNCRFRSKVSFDTVSDKTSLLCFNYSDTGINKTCKVKVRNSSFDNTKEGTSSIPLVKKALAKNMGDKDVVFENCSFRNTLSYLYGSIQYGDYYNCLFEVPSLALQLYADKAIKIVGSTIVKNDTVTDRAILTIESITKNFTEDSVVLFLTGNTFQYSGVSIIDIPATNTNDKKVSFLNNLFSTKYISEESTLYINLKNKFDTFYYSNSRMDYNRYIGTTGTEGTPSVNNAGQVFYDSTLKKMKLWNGTAWTNLDGTTL